MRKPTNVTLLNLSEGAVHDSEALRIHGTLQSQVTREVLPVWGVDARLGYLRPGTRTPADPKTAWLVILRDNEQAKTLGLEDLTPAGLPLGKVFAGELLAQGRSVSAALSRELIQMLVDPSLTGLEHDPRGKLLHCREACAPVASDACAYRVNGILVSNFVTPAYFQTGAAGPYDYRRVLRAPFEIAPDGELVAIDLESADFVGPPPAPGSRTERRHHAHVDALIRSTGASFLAPPVQARPVMPAPERAGPPVVRPGVAQPVAQAIRAPLRAQHPDGAPPLAIDHKAPPPPVRAKTKEVLALVPVIRQPHPAPLRMSTRELPKAAPAQAEEPRKAFPPPVRASMPGAAKAPSSGKTPVLADPPPSRRSAAAKTPHDTPSPTSSSAPAGDAPQA
jgi:hypothetical protein